jgi:hypothetical protein
VKRTSWSAGLSVTGDGAGVVAHAGSVGLRLQADRTGLTGEVCKALARRGFVPRHDRGRVLVDVAVMLAGGGEAIADIRCRAILFAGVCPHTCSVLVHVLTSKVAVDRMRAARPPLLIRRPLPNL